MSSIALFVQSLNTESNTLYNIYKQLYAENIVTKPIIYTDKSTINVDSNIPVFHTYYIRQSFNFEYILLSHDDVWCLPEYLENRLIVIHDKNTNLYDTNYKFSIDSQDNIIAKIKEIL